jgi:glycosyltransferase involved in cell wall biosynthesis
MDRPDVLVSVIVPVKDDAERLRTCLQALERQSLAEQYEVIVVDNNSHDDPAAVVGEHHGVRLEFELAPSSYAARNTGVRLARGKILAFTDSDCVPDADWLERGCAVTLDAPGPCFVGGRVDVFPENPSAPTATELFELAQAFPQRHYVEHGRYAVTANLFVERRLFDRVGAFASELVSSGDREWGQRASAAGAVPVYAEDAVVRHPARRELRQLRRKAERVQLGLMQLRRQRGEHLGPRNLAMSFRPPVRSTLRHVSRLPRRDVPTLVRYAGVAVLSHYLHAYHQLRIAVQYRGRSFGLPRIADHRRKPDSD